MSATTAGAVSDPAGDALTAAGAHAGGDDAPRPLPCVVVGGYLGAGKTTLVNHLLRHPDGRRIAVLVNDFGDLPIDADLIRAASADVLELAGGCVCCSFGSDLVGTLARVAARQPRPDVLLLETSGVADPAAVARSARLARDLAIDGIVVVADVETLRQRAADPYVGDTVRQQLLVADLLLLNKTDLLPATGLAALHDWAATRAPRARLVATRRAEVPADLVLGLAEPRSAPTGEDPTDVERWRSRPLAGQPAAAESVFVSCTRRYDGPLDVAALGTRLTAEDLGVVRAKGVLTDRDGRRCTLQVVGRRCEVVPHDSDPAAPGALVVIGLRGRFDPARIA